MSQGDSLLALIQIPSEMVMEIEAAADREQQPFPTQPAFAMYDAVVSMIWELSSRDQGRRF